MQEREKIRRQRLEEEQARREDLLARELRIYTKGTAAAKAVFTSFAKNQQGHKQQKTRKSPAPNPETSVYSPRKPQPKVKPKYTLTSDARKAMAPSPEFENMKNKSLSTSWNRHALNFFGKLSKAKVSNEHVAAHRAISNGTGIPAHGAPEQVLMDHTGKAAHEYEERTSSPKKLSDEMRDESTIPLPSDPKFEDWIRFRFGKITTV